jgi:sugar phosphate isomerase/epimerase
VSIPRVLISTTSHKRAPLAPTLEVFARLGMRDLDLNLSPIVEGGLTTAEVEAAIRAANQRVWVVSGGWCDFFDRPPDAERTFASVSRQAEAARALGVHHLRLFFGQLERADYSPAVREVARTNILRLADEYPDVVLMFENHDGASLDPAICADILHAVNRPTVGMNFDPINFARVGVDIQAALTILRPLIGHVHLKGVKGNHLCEFDEGDVDLKPFLAALEAGGYTGSFTVEYEGAGDATSALHRSVGRARAVLQAS